MPVIAILRRFVAVKGVKGDGKPMVTVIECNHVGQAFGRDEVKDMAEDIHVRFDKGKAGPSRNVVDNHIEHECCLAFVRLTDHVDGLAPVRVGKDDRFVLVFFYCRNE